MFLIHFESDTVFSFLFVCFVLFSMVVVGTSCNAHCWNLPDVCHMFVSRGTKSLISKDFTRQNASLTSGKDLRGNLSVKGKIRNSQSQLFVLWLTRWLQSYSDNNTKTKTLLLTVTGRKQLRGDDDLPSTPYISILQLQLFWSAQKKEHKTVKCGKRLTKSNQDRERISAWKRLKGGWDFPV